MASSLNREELERLSKKSPPKKMTSKSVQTVIVTSENNSTESVALVLPKQISGALEQFEDQMGGREKIIENLSLSELDKKEAHFLALLYDPQREKDSISSIARDAGLKPLQIVELFRSAAFAKAHALSLGKLSDALPKVVEDIAEKSVDAKIKCPTCFGDGRDVNNELCVHCAGRGEIMRFSDLDRQKIVLETAGLTKKSPGVNVQVNQQVGVINPGNFFSRYVKDSDQTANDISVVDITPKENE